MRRLRNAKEVAHEVEYDDALCNNVVRSSSGKLYAEVYLDVQLLIDGKFYDSNETERVPLKKRQQ